jgi:hypothetical protein
MKRFLKIFVIVIIVVVILTLIAAVIFVKTFDPSRYKAQITSAAQDSLGRPVDFKDITLDFSLRRGIDLRLVELVIGEHPDFGSDEFLKAEAVTLSLSLKDFIFKREFRVLGASVESPLISVIRLKDGRLNLQSLGGSSQAVSDGTEENSQRPEQKKSVSTEFRLPAIFVNNFSLDRGEIVFTDRGFEPPLSLTFNEVDLRADDFAFNRYFNINAKTGIAGGKPALTFSGQARYVTAQGTFDLKDSSIEFNVSEVPLLRLKEGLKSFNALSEVTEAEGQMRITISKLEAGPDGLSGFKASGRLREAFLKIKSLLVPLRCEQADFALTGSDFTLHSTQFSLDNAVITADFAIKDYLKEQNFSTRITLDSFKLAEVLDQGSQEIQLKGTLSGNIDLVGRGFDPARLEERLRGSGNLLLKEGTLTNINILRTVLGKFSFISGLPVILEKNLPQAFKDNFRKEDTIITSSTAAFTLSGGRIQIEPLELSADDFTFKGKGFLTFQQIYEFNGNFLIPDKLSLQMVGASRELEVLQNASGQIAFPLKVSGQGQKFSFTPELGRIGSSIIENKARQQLDKFLDKYKDKEETKPAGDRQGEETVPSSDGSQPQNTGSEDFLEKMIDSIVK